MNSKFQLKRCKSMCSLQTNYSNEYLDVLKDEGRVSRSLSESSMEVCVGNGSESVLSERYKDSGIGEEAFVMLEHKIDRISDLFLDQCRLLTDIKNDIRNSRATIEKSDLAQNKLLAELLKKALAQTRKMKEIEADPDAASGHSFNSRARSLLDAIESRQAFNLDREIRDALVDFLQSDELQQQMVSATMESVRGMISGQLSRDMSAVYQPMIERSQRRLGKHLTKVLESAFVELEESSASFSSAVYKTSRSLRRELEKHETLLQETALSNKSYLDYLQSTAEQVLQTEMKQWRHQAFDGLCPPMELYEQAEAEHSPTLASLPAVNGCSLIDQLMQKAEITKLIEDGHINLSFEKALSAGDLSLVVWVCRAAERAARRAPRRLPQPVLMSLVQQLATDLLHDTPLKCRYLEEALLNLNPSNTATRMHLPLVVAEVRKHLSNFLATYPGHVASRRVMMIIKAADNLLQ